MVKIFSSWIKWGKHILLRIGWCETGFGFSLIRERGFAGTCLLISDHMSSYALKGSVFIFEKFFHLSSTSHCLTLWFYLTRCFKTFWEASLVAQWKSNSLQRRGSQSHPRSWLGRIPHAMEQLVRAPQCWACAPEPRSHNHWATLSEPVLRNEGRHHNEKPAHGNERGAPAHCKQRKPAAATKTQHRQK